MTPAQAAAQRARPSAASAAEPRRALREVPRRVDLFDPRALEFARLREAGLTLAEIGARHGLSRQRVAQIIDQAGRVDVNDVRQARRGAQARRAQASANHILERYRHGLHPLQIARETRVPVRHVRATIKQSATDADRAQRKHAHAIAAPAQAPRYTDEQLTAGVREVASRLGHAPTGRQYARLADQLGLASMQTVYQRFGGWRKALTAAGLEPQHAPRRDAPEWHLAACWNAVCSVADELGDPPRYRRYLELAATREDLPSPSTLRVRLGLWSGIAAALKLRDANGSALDRERVRARA